MFFHSHYSTRSWCGRRRSIRFSLSLSLKFWRLDHRICVDPAIQPPDLCHAVVPPPHDRGVASRAAGPWPPCGRGTTPWTARSSVPAQPTRWPKGWGHNRAASPMHQSQHGAGARSRGLPTRMGCWTGRPHLAPSGSRTARVARSHGLLAYWLGCVGCWPFQTTHVAPGWPSCTGDQVTCLLGMLDRMAC